MFERLTDRARAAVVQAEREAMEFEHPRLGTEHLLLGIAHDDASVGGRALSSLGVTYDVVRRQVAAAVPRAATVSRELVPLSPDAKRLFELSARTALRQEHTRIGTSDLVLSLLDMDGCTARQVLDGLGIDSARARARVVEMLIEPTATSYAPELSSMRPVQLELSPQTQELARRALRMGCSYLTRRYASAKLVHRASTTVRLMRTLPPDPKPDRSLAPRALGSGADGGAQSRLARAACARCGILSPNSGTLYVRSDGALICERCVGGAPDAARGQG